jgi:hypothetical protein
MSKALDIFNNISGKLQELQSQFDVVDESQQQIIQQRMDALMVGLSDLNVGVRNENRTEQLAEKILQCKNEKQKAYTSFLSSKSVYAIVTAPTQVGKSAAVKEMIEVCLRSNVPVIVSSDNKTDQQDQLFNRIRRDLCGTDDVVLIRVSDSNFSNKIKNCVAENKLFVIFCLDNQSQIEKIIDVWSVCKGRSKFNIKQIEKIMLLHDEGDCISKDANIETMNSDQALSHQKWIELVHEFNTSFNHIDLKRVFVTATPENCCALYNIESAHIIQLEIPASYRGWKDIAYSPLENDFDIKDILMQEVTRIKQNAKTSRSGEAILYCIERNTDCGENNHNEVLESLTFLPQTTIHTYNSKGMTVYTQNENLKRLLRVIDVEGKQKKVKATERNGLIYLNKQVTIRKFYSLCQEANETTVVTIGKDLINRGISYVSEHSEFPLTATTMVYKPGQTMHVVGDVQTIGRITGTARPDLARRLYAPQTVIDNYVNFNKNQQQFLADITQNGDEVTSDIWQRYEFKNRLTKSIDRKRLGLKLKYASVPPPTYESTMKHLIDLWWNKNTDSGRILKFFYETECGATFIEFSEACELQRPEQWWNHLTTNGKEYKFVYEKTDNDIMKLQKESRQYIDSKINNNV